MNFLKQKKHSFSFTVLIIFVLTIFATGCNMAKNEEKLKAFNQAEDPMAIPDLLPRTGELANAEEWPKTQEKVTELKQKIAAKPEDTKLRLQTAMIFIAEQRITGEHHYYYTAIEKILNGVLRLAPDNFEANVFKASLRMSEHKFAEAKALAEKARSINPDNAYVYGILVDANVELGNYEEAVNVSDKMQQIKPSLESYSRASYLREIYGDYPGAIAAMKLAVQAGLSGSEPQCWSRNILGDLYFNTGQIELAEATYRENLALRPSYAQSMAGLAKVETKKKNYKEALTLLDSAASIMQINAFEEQKADVYMAMGDTAAANNTNIAVQKLLIADANSPQHSVSLELGRSFLKTNQWDSAGKYLNMELAARPQNIDVNNELAWLAYNQNDLQKAKEYLKTALRTGSKNPELLKRANAINTAK